MYRTINMDVEEEELIIINNEMFHNAWVAQFKDSFATSGFNLIECFLFCFVFFLCL